MGGVGVDLENLRSPPEPVPGELLRRQLGAREVRDPALGARKPRDALAIHRLPHVPTDLILGSHPVPETVDAIASAILERASIPPQTRLRTRFGAGAGGRGT